MTRLARLFACTVFLSGIVTPGSPLRAGDWTQFRGPTGQGISTAKGVPVHWSRDKNVAWRIELPGKAWSSPILLRGRLYLTTAVPGDGDTQVLRVLCLNAENGESIWNVEVFRHGAANKHPKNGHASPTPLTDGKHLFVHFGTNGTACLDLDGEVIWRNRELVYDPRHGSGGSPVLTETSLVISCDGYDTEFVAALDRATGKIRWKTPRPQHEGKTFSFTTPLVITVKDKTQVVSPGSSYVCSYEPDTGRELWRVHYPLGYSVVPRPLYAHGLVYVCSGFDTPRLIAFRPTGSGDITEAQVAWTKRESVPNSPTPIIVGDELYMVNDKGIASCLDARTGKQHWRKRIGGNYSASPIYAEGKIYFQSETGKGVVIRAAKAFTLLAENDLNDRTLASYAVDDGVLFIRSETHLYRIEEND